jgi:hypothetical protein
MPWHLIDVHPQELMMYPDHSISLTGCEMISRMITSKKTERENPIGEMKLLEKFTWTAEIEETKVKPFLKKKQTDKKEQRLHKKRKIGDDSILSNADLSVRSTPPPSHSCSLSPSGSDSVRSTPPSSPSPSPSPSGSGSGSSSPSLGPSIINMKEVLKDSPEEFNILLNKALALYRYLSLSLSLSFFFLLFTNFVIGKISRAIKSRNP